MAPASALTERTATACCFVRDEHNNSCCPHVEHTATGGMTVFTPCMRTTASLAVPVTYQETGDRAMGQAGAAVAAHLP